MNADPITPNQAFSMFIQSIEEVINRLFTSLSVQSILQSILHVHAILQIVVLLFEKDEDSSNSDSNDMDEFVIKTLNFSESWKSDIRMESYRFLQNWIEEEFEKISQLSQETISKIHTISELAQTKKEVSKLSEEICRSWILESQS